MVKNGQIFDFQEDKKRKNTRVFASRWLFADFYRKHFEVVLMPLTMVKLTI